MAEQPHNDENHPAGDVPVESLFADEAAGMEPGANADLGLDPAQQALADALRFSFRILSFVMVILFIVYAVSNTFNVESGESAVRLWMGEIGGVSSDDRVLEQGGPYFWAPFPLGEYIKIPNSTRTIELDDAFWFEVGEREATMTRTQLRNSRSGPLNPVRDGSLITGDFNIVHARWKIEYVIHRPDEYIENVGDLDLLDRLVRSVAEQGIVHTVSQAEADELIKGTFNRASAMAQMNTALSELGAGAVIREIYMETPTVPMSVVAAFESVTEAEADRAQAIVTAQQGRARVLGETAGEASTELLSMIRDYERLSETGTPEELAQAEARLDEAFDTLRAGENQLRIGGYAARVINEARTYRTRVVEEVQSEAEVFNLLLPEYEKNPRIVLNRLWQETKETILASDNISVETFYMPPGQVQMQLNRDPSLVKQRQEQQLQEVDRDRF